MALLVFQPIRHVFACLLLCHSLIGNMATCAPSRALFARQYHAMSALEADIKRSDAKQDVSAVKVRVDSP